MNCLRQDFRINNSKKFEIFWKKNKFLSFSNVDMVSIKIKKFIYITIQKSIMVYKAPTS